MKKNLFGISRKKWSQIIDDAEATIASTAFMALTFYALFMAWFGRCL